MQAKSVGTSTTPLIRFSIVRIDDTNGRDA